jgi:hypothetical protein
MMGCRFVSANRESEEECMRLGFFHPRVLPLPSVCHSFVALLPRVPREMPTMSIYQALSLGKKSIEITLYSEQQQ